MNAAGGRNTTQKEPPFFVFRYHAYDVGFWLARLMASMTHSA
jgi:hypothetical protein